MNNQRECVWRLTRRTTMDQSPMSSFEVVWKMQCDKELFSRLSPPNICVCGGKIKLETTDE